jgi:hypothetical protein
MSKELSAMLLAICVLLFIIVIIQILIIKRKDINIRLLEREVKALEGHQTICNNTYIKRCKELRDEFQEALNFTREAYNKENQHLRFRIDNLMLEYCPEEMTIAQFANYAAHQKKVDPDFNLVLPDTPEEDKQIQDVEYKEEIKNEST